MQYEGAKSRKVSYQLEVFSQKAFYVISIIGCLLPVITLNYTVCQVSVGHPSEVDEIFDAISYSKGASVIRMLHDYIGDTVKKQF